jgi:cytochrome P450
MRELVKDPLEFFLSVARIQGDVACYRPAPEPAFLINHPDYVAHVLGSHWANYSKDTYSNRMFKSAVGEGILTNEGEAWKRARRAMQPYFSRRRVAQLDGMINRHCQSMLDRWEAEAAADRPVNISREMGLLTLSITLEALFGVTLGGIATTIGTAVDTILDLLEKPRRARFRNGRQAIADAVDEVVSRRSQMAHPPNDLFAAIAELNAHADAESQRRSVHGQVFTVLMAGYETTASALTWTWVRLSEHEEVVEALRAELTQVLGGRAPLAADLEELGLLRMAFEETLRINPPAWVIGRKALRPDRLDGHAIPEGSVVAVSPYVMHRNPAYWEMAEEFDPLRFESSHPEIRPPHAYIPFGVGPRRCLGENLALVEAPLIIANVLQRFELRLIPGQDVRPQPLFILRPPTTLLMNLKRVQ